ncbi:MAG: hypothetical protein AAB731_04955, partial [Patescibacteria group bacterium]
AQVDSAFSRPRDAGARVLGGKIERKQENKKARKQKKQENKKARKQESKKSKKTRKQFYERISRES